MPSDHKCGCLEPATWFLLVFTDSIESDREGWRAVDHWAACDVHLVEAARALSDRQPAGTPFNIILRAENRAGTAQ